MILTIGPGGCGFTFLNWSLSWLRGDITYYTLEKEECNVIGNPLCNDHTAHAYKKDHISCKNIERNLQNAHDASIVYVVPADQQEFNYIVGLPDKKIIFDASDNPKSVFLRQLSSIKTEVGQLEHFLSTKYDVDVARSVVLDMSEQFVSYYPKDVTNNAMYVCSRDIFYELDTAIEKICKFLEIKIDSTRFDHWCSVYQQYKTNNQKFFTHEILNKSVDKALRQQILKEFYLWKTGKHPHINRNLQA